MEKSKLFASIGVPRSKKDRLAQITQIRFTCNLEKYLRFKLYKGRIKKEDFWDVMDRECPLNWLRGRVGSSTNLGDLLLLML